MTPPYQLFVGPDEVRYERAADFLNFAIKNDDKFLEPITDRKLPADYRIENDDLEGCNIEVKLPQDAIASVLSGHLAQQAIDLAALDEPAIIVVWGECKEVYNKVSKVGLKGYRSWNDQIADWRRYQSFKRDVLAEYGIPMLEFPRLFVKTTKGQRVIQDPAEEAIRTAIKLLDGGNIIRHLRKNDGLADPVGILARVRGVGKETGEGLMADYRARGLTLGDLVMDAKLEPSRVSDIKVNGRRVGKTAEAIAAAFWG